MATAIVPDRSVGRGRALGAPSADVVLAATTGLSVRTRPEPTAGPWLPDAPGHAPGRPADPAAVADMLVVLATAVGGLAATVAS